MQNTKQVLYAIQADHVCILQRWQEENHGRVDEDNKQMEVSLYTEHSVRHSATMRYVEPRDAVRTESGTIQVVKLT